MDDNAKLAIKIGIGAVIAYVAYRYLQSSGLWAEWFGTSTTSATTGTTTAAVTGATTTDSTAGTSTTSTPATTTVATTSVQAAASPVAAGSLSFGGTDTDQLDAWMGSAIGTKLATSDQWCAGFKAITGTDACSAGVNFTGIQSGTPMSSYVWLNAYKAYQSLPSSGTSGLGWTGWSIPDPYRWVQ